MLLYESFKRSIGTVLENEIVKMSLFYDFETFNDVWMVQQLMNFYFLFEQLQILLDLANTALIDDFNCKLAS